jgi:hyperosmotically inducible periplasmic protein
MRTRRVSAALIPLLCTLAVAPGVSVGCASGGGGHPAKINQTLDDATIQTRVKTAILNDPAVGGDQIDVTSQDGVVTLSGVIKSADHEARAAELARKIGGVKDVKTALKLEAQP